MSITAGAARGEVPLGRQAALGLGAAVAYLSVRGAVSAADGRAQNNADAVARLERSLGLREFAAPLWAGAGEWLYTWGHWLLAVALLVGLARRAPALYYRARDTMLLTAGVALFAFVVYPVAPPDVSGGLASLPSLDAAWDVVLGLSVAAFASRAWVRVAGVGLAGLLLWSVVLTGHHYLIDVLAGAALALVAWLFVGSRRRPQRLRGYAGWDGLDLHKTDNTA
ncbi:phosphatase PAP2 family protein [Dactylosporangium vinaceum]|uniref:Phosphatase PAP2 family protein n=1 Tax=Dactylosporangium vinaceum TaxID=53362 RepID=A0ABV5LYP8_9ACTN|nr:phosphatase PAP2 family protein [Dactylosporangium vinaceum]UAB95282.1 phosphatase PAP2 family protein [Dactylosporangium vinaceum]